MILDKSRKLFCMFSLTRTVNFSQLSRDKGLDCFILPASRIKSLSNENDSMVCLSSGPGSMLAFFTA